MRIIKFPCRGLNYTLCILTIAVSIILIITASRFNMPKVSSFSSVTVNKLQSFNSKRLVSKGKGYPPVLAYWICGTKGESKQMMRLLKAIYHPRNQYLLQLDDASSDSERLDLAETVQSFKVFEAFGNVDVVGKSYAINRMGSSGLSAVLHAAALLLKLNSDWDWFITLSASDYPLMTQDDILHAFTFLPRDLNFIHFTNKTIIRKEQRDLNQIVVDPSLYYETSTPLFFAVESRDPPDTFNVFAGSPWVIFTRAFMEYCVSGWDNLPRKLLMFFTNMVYPIESYFHTLLCNSIDFHNTSIDNLLMFSLWDTDPSESLFLDLSHYHSFSESGAAFARPFAPNDLVLDKIDDLILPTCSNLGLVSGQWCSSELPDTTDNNNNTDKNHSNNIDSSSEAQDHQLLFPANIDVVKPGPYGIKLKTLLSNEVVKRREYTTNHCQKL